MSETSQTKLYGSQLKAAPEPLLNSVNVFLSQNEAAIVRTLPDGIVVGVTMNGWWVLDIYGGKQGKEEEVKDFSQRVLDTFLRKDEMLLAGFNQKSMAVLEIVYGKLAEKGLVNQLPKVKGKKHE